MTDSEPTQNNPEEMKNTLGKTGSQPAKIQGLSQISEEIENMSDMYSPKNAADLYAKDGIVERNESNLSSPVKRNISSGNLSGNLVPNISLENAGPAISLEKSLSQHPSELNNIDGVPIMGSLQNSTSNISYNFNQNQSDGLNESDMIDQGLNNASKLTSIHDSNKLFDFIFPGGKLASYCRVDKIIEFEEEQIMYVCNKFKFNRPQPVIILSGLRDSNIETRTPFLEGITRAAYRSDAVLIDSGVKSGIECSAIRRNLNLIGVFPNEQIKLPMLNAKSESSGELTNGHTHLFAITDKFYQKWGNEIKLKMKIAENITKGSAENREKKVPQCKTIFVQFGDDPDIIEEIKIAVSMEIPIIVVKGNPTNDSIIKALNESTPVEDEILKSQMEKGHFYSCESDKADDMAAAVHFLLTIKPF